MGYQQYALVQGYNLYSPVFEAINGSLSLQDIKLVGDSVTGGGANSIVLLDADGMTQGTYGWWLPDDGTGEEEGCWFDGDNWEKINVTLTEGQGFYLYAVDSGMSILSSGQVKLSQYTTTLGAGYNLVGNCSPVDLDIQKLKIVGDNVVGGGANSIVLLDADGITQGTYGWWLPDDGTGEDEGCWFDGDNWEKITATIKAGEGLYVYAVGPGMKLTIPSAL